MGLFDWLLTDPSQPDGGFLAALLNGKLGAASNAQQRPALPYAASSGLLGESPLINMLRSGFAGMNAANGYSGFGPQFAAGMSGGANAMAQRRQQMMQDRYNSLALDRALGGQSASSDAVQAAPTAAGQSAYGLCSGCAERNQAATAAEPIGVNPNFAAGPKPGLPGSTQETPIKIASPEEAARLPAGTWFETPDGRILRRVIVGAR